MNSGAFILNDNIMHLESWMQQNEALRDNLLVEGSDLVWKNGDMIERVNIENFYLPTLLYNENFQRDIQDSNKIDAEDLFHIIEVHVLAQEFQTDFITNQTIVEFQYLTDQNNEPFIAFRDNEGKSYKLKNDLQESFQIYHNLKREQGEVKLEDFKRELEKLNHESK